MEVPYLGEDMSSVVDDDITTTRIRQFNVNSIPTSDKYVYGLQIVDVIFIFLNRTHEIRLPKIKQPI